MNNVSRSQSISKQVCVCVCIDMRACVCVCVLQSDMQELLFLAERSHPLNYAAKILRPGHGSVYYSFLSATAENKSAVMRKCQNEK